MIMEITLDRENIPMKLNQDMILYYHFQLGQKTNIVLLIGIIAVKTEILNRKAIRFQKCVYNWNNERFKDHDLWIVRTRIKAHQEANPD